MFKSPIKQLCQRLYVLLVYCLLGAIILILWNEARKYKAELKAAAPDQGEVYTRPTPMKPQCLDTQYLDHNDVCKYFKCKDTCLDGYCEHLPGAPIRFNTNCTKCDMRKGVVLDVEYKMIDGEKKPYGVCKDCEQGCKLCTSLEPGSCLKCQGGWNMETKNGVRACSAFQCDDGVQVISNNKQCNGAYDCVNDGSDEYQCPARKSTFQTFKQCPDKKGWIVDYKFCNDIPDCFDGSDENGCSCRRDWFHCLDKRGCFHKTKIHDGLAHCRDKSDEGDHPIRGLPGNYTMKGDGGNYRSGQRFCKSIGRMMLQIYSQKQLDAVKDYYGLFRNNVNYWIGMQDRENNKVWTWNDGTKLTFTDWGVYTGDFMWKSSLRRPYGQCGYLPYEGKMYAMGCENWAKVICMSEDAWVAPDPNIPCVYCTPGKIPPHGTSSTTPVNKTES